MMKRTGITLSSGRNEIKQEAGGYRLSIKAYLDY
jgi:hypothetical protein